MNWRNFFRRTQKNRDLDAEIEAHLALEVQQRIERGESPEDAARNARRDFGNVALVKEVTREGWGTRTVERLIEDVRYGIRLLSRNKGFTVSVILILALGIGATTTVFALVNALVLKELPVAAPDELVWFKDPAFSYPIFEQTGQRGRHLFQGFFGWNIETMTTQWDADIERALTLFVTGEFYPTLGVNALIGRPLSPQDDGLVAVITYDCWQRRFHADPSVIGKTVSIERIPFTIIGVMPKGFFGVAPGLAPEVTVPLMTLAQLEPSGDLKAPTSDQLHLMARLRKGLSRETANQQLQAIWPGIMEATTWDGQPAERRARYLSRRTELMPGAGGFSRVRSQFAEPLWVLMTLVGLLLLVACASLANLWLARAFMRQREIALRFALGATRLRVIRQLFTEGVVVASIGAALSVLVANWGATAMVRMLSTEEDPIILLQLFDVRVVAFAFGIGLITAVFFTIVPALRLSSIENPRIISQPMVRGRLRQFLVISQVSLALILVAGGVLFGRSLYHLVATNPGFRTGNLMIVSVDPLLAGYRDARLMQFYDQAIERWKAVPGVQSVSLSMYPPISDQMGSWTQSIQVDGQPFINTGTNSVFFNLISPGYFETIGQPLVRGRDFGAADHESNIRTCIVTESLAADFFPNQEAIGRLISIGKGANRQNLTIVGIVKDAKYRRLQEPVRRIAYLPYRQSVGVLNGSNLVAEIRTSLPLNAIAQQLRQEVRTLDPAVVVRLGTLNERIRDSLVTERTFAILSTFLGLVALSLAVAGLYGLLGYVVSKRTPEIGLRLALGAARTDVLWMVMRQSLMLSLAGLLVGIAASLALARFAEKLVYGVSARDPLSIICSALVVLALTLAASYVPARRAVRVDPMTALRYE